MHVGISSRKVDICFANSLKAVKGSLKFAISLHLLQCTTMGIMIPLDIYAFKNTSEQVLSFFIAAMCVTLLSFISKISHLRCYLQDEDVCYSIAEDLNHIALEDAVSDRLDQDPRNSRRFVSERVYNAQTNSTIEETTPEVRRMVEAGAKNMIRSLAMSKDPFNRCIQTIAGGISFALFIYGIVVLAKYPMIWVEVLVMVLFLISEFLIQFQVFACLLLVVFSPLFCLCCCFYVCLCKEGARQAQLPEPVRASLGTVQNSDGSPCSICFQDIMLEEQVIVLPCSEKHIFHENCIRGWTSLKPTCPICRHDLSQ